MLKFYVIVIFLIVHVSSFEQSLDQNEDDDVVISNFVSSKSSDGPGLIRRKIPIQSAIAQPQNGFIVNNNTFGVCFCVPTGSCSSSNPGGSTDGSGVIDPRIVNNQPTTPAPSSTLFPVSSGIPLTVSSQSFCPQGLERCCPSSGYSCGIRYPPMSGSRPPTQGQAAYGAYPWQVVVLTTADVFQASGSLIDNFHIVTAAHKIVPLLSSGQQLKIRVGEWDASSSSEPIPAQEFAISRTFIHPQYNAANLRNNIAILRTSTSVTLGQSPAVSTVCLPSNMLSTERCWVAGWGKSDFSNSGQYQAIMKEVDVPLVPQSTCQNLLRSTRLGSNFQLDTTSFMCAGGEAGKDACTGDGGAPLVCLNSGRWYMMGLVAWGIGCGTSNVPGVYVNIPSYISWIQATARTA